MHTCHYLSRQERFKFTWPQRQKYLMSETDALASLLYPHETDQPRPAMYHFARAKLAELKTELENEVSKQPKEMKPSGAMDGWN